MMMSMGDMLLFIHVMNLRCHETFYIEHGMPVFMSEKIEDFF